MTEAAYDEVRVLKLTLHGHLVGYLAGFQQGRNVLLFTDAYKTDLTRPTFSLITHPRFPHADKVMAKPWIRKQRLHPSLSNLLPEGSLRELIAQGLKVHVDNEFQIISYLGNDLPGALIAEPLEPEDVPKSVLSAHGNAKAVSFDAVIYENKFSLAGVQMKFSMKETDGRYTLSSGNELGDWIIKTPSTQHREVPANEYTAMTLASLAGVNIPQIRLVDLSKLDNLPSINLPDEQLAFAIKRFDRSDEQRIHIEDFAQVLVKYPHEKYNTASSEQIARILYQFSGDGLYDTQQFARRLLVNILLANGDAHLKNWSLIYADQITPRLSPAYDIVTTSVYIEGEREFALNLGGTKAWHEVSYANFEIWAEKSDMPWRAIKPHIDDAMNSVRKLWPAALEKLPMNPMHKDMLVAHWQKLHKDFKIMS